VSVPADELADLARAGAALVALEPGHSLGTARAHGRAGRGDSRGAGERQSSALKRLYTLKEAAIHLAIGYGKVRDYVARGLLPAVKLPGGKLIHVAREDLERFVEAYRETNAPFQPAGSPPATRPASDRWSGVGRSPVPLEPRAPGGRRRASSVRSPGSPRPSSVRSSPAGGRGGRPR
jgi:excisionase family DNA binding protein